MAKRKQKISRVPANSFTPYTCPAVSVIIPLYNMEKYIGECLDSLLVQTFQNFEVIVVDDCSTDSSYAIVESYAEKFGGRLTLSRMEKNTGGGAFPRNKGISLSRGEYIFFVDADDFITKNALEEMYTAAKDNDADVVYMGARYLYTTEGGAKLKRDKIGRKLEADGQEDKITLTVDDPYKNLQAFLLGSGLFLTPWTKFVKRNFLAENEINFRDLDINEDFLWFIELLCCAKRVVRYPNPVYFYRKNLSSISWNKQRIDKHLQKWFDSIIRFEKALSEVLSKRKILRENPDYFYAAMALQVNFCLERTFEERLKVQPEQIFEILRRDFESKGNFDLTVPILFSFLDTQQKYLMQAQQQFEQFNKFAAQAQARIAQLEAELKRKS